MWFTCFHKLIFSLVASVSSVSFLTLRRQHFELLLFCYDLFLDPRGGSLSLTHVVVLVDLFVSQPTVFIETS